MQKTGTVFKGKAKIIPPDTFFLPYQKKWIEDESRLKLMEKGRQIGLSLSTAYRCVEKCAAADNRNDIWVSSRDDWPAKLFIEDCKRFADALYICRQNNALVTVPFCRIIDKRRIAYRSAVYAHLIRTAG